jgi:hypothetical protein
MAHAAGDDLDVLPARESRELLAARLGEITETAAASLAAIPLEEARLALRDLSRGQRRQRHHTSVTAGAAGWGGRSARARRQP